jgi:LPPG:FO 2-phospho-L-lactate transferase
LTGRKVIAVSPLIAGQAIKGPAAKMCSELGLSPTSLTVARHYGAQSEGGVLMGFMLDLLDMDEKQQIQDLGIQVSVVDTLMKTPSDRVRLASQSLAFGERLLSIKEV